MSFRLLQVNLGGVLKKDFDSSLKASAAIQRSKKLTENWCISLVFLVDLKLGYASNPSCHLHSF